MNFLAIFVIVLEQLKFSEPDHIATYVNKHKINTASAVAILANEYILTYLHRSLVIGHIDLFAHYQWYTKKKKLMKN